MLKTRMLGLLNFIALAIHISLSYATQFKLINEKDVGEISNQLPSLFTPAGFTFSIWGLIYLALILFCIYHLVIAFTKTILHPANRDTLRIGPWFMVNNLAAAAWLLAWTHGQILFSVILIFLQLITLVAIHLQLRIHNVKETVANKIFTQFPLSIYFSWITIAVIANTAGYLAAISWNGFGLGYSAVSWTRIMIAVAVAKTMAVVMLRNNVTFGLVVVWALYGIISKLQAVDSISNKEIIQTAWIGMGVTVIICLFQFIKNLTNKNFRHSFPEALPVK